MRKTIRHIVLIIVLLVVETLSAQNIHFSQYYAAPYHLNPAMTGAFHGSYRVILNNKDQWGSISTAFRTLGASIDFALPFKYDLLGIGFSAYQDKSGLGGLTTMNATFSAAYHVALGYDGINDLAFGANFSYNQRNVMTDDLLFPNQYDGDYYFNPNQSIGEDIGSPSLMYLNAVFGVHWFYTPKDYPSYFAGFSIRNLLRPVNVFQDATYRQAIGFNVHFGSSIDLDKKLKIDPKMNFQMEGSARELVVGMELEKYMIRTSIEKASIFGGAYYRIADALVITGGADISNIRFAVSYDLTISTLTPANNTLGGAEISFQYKGIINSKKGFKCPKFDPTY